MNEGYKNFLYIWDLDRSDSLFHARCTVAQLSDAGRAAKTVKTDGRFVVLVVGELSPTEIAIFSFPNIATLGESLRGLLDSADIETGLEALVMGLPDTVRMVEAMLAARPLAYPVRVVYQPQQDGTTLDSNQG